MFLNRPIAAFMFILATLIFGAIALYELPVNLLPSVENPELLVRTEWNGASAREVDHSINKPLEAYLSTINGIHSIHSIAKQGLSLISLQFAWHTNMDLAFLNTREKLDQVRLSLPQSVSRPELVRSNPSDRPVAVLSVTSPAAGENNLSGRIALRQWTDQVLTRRLEQVDGIAQAVIVGAVQPEVDIRFDPNKLNKYGLTVGQVQQVLQQANLFSASGELREGWYRYSLKIESRLTSLQAMRTLPVTLLGSNKILRLADIADVRMGEVDPVSFSLLDGVPVITVLVKKDYGSNTVSVFNRLKPVLVSLRRANPGIHISVLRESATIIHRTINNLIQSLIIGAVLAFIVLFIFLRDPRLPTTIGVSIPVSIFITFFVMYLLGIQLNIISLSGLTLGIGMLVDNSIVVLENINRYQVRPGWSIMQAASVGTREIALAVTASTLTTISVFLPLLFLGGFEGILFRDQALTLSISLLASLLVALAVIPVLAVRLGRAGAKITVRDNYRAVQNMQKGYKRILDRVLDHPSISAVVLSGIILLAVIAFLLTPRRPMPVMIPAELDYQVTLPSNTSLLTSRYTADQMTQSLEARTGIQNVLAIGGYTDQSNLSKLSSEGLDRFTLRVPVTGREQIRKVQTMIAKWGQGHPDWSITEENGPDARGISSILQFSSVPLVLHLVGPDRSQSERFAAPLDAYLKQVIPDWTMRLKYNRQQKMYGLAFRDRVLINLGLSRGEVLGYLQSLSTGKKATEWIHNQNQVDVRLFSGSGRFMDPQEIRLHLNGHVIPLTQVASIVPIKEPEQLERIDQTPVLTYLTNVSLWQWWWHGDQIRTALRQFMQKQGIRIGVGGLALQLQSLLHQMGLLLLFSVIVIYIIMAAQYESLIYPLIILFSIPFAWSGSMLFLWITGQSLNIFSFLGLLILSGVAVNDAILIVDFMSRYYRETGQLRAAIRQAGEHRFRPVTMTALTTVFGLIPMVIPIGTGWAYRLSLGVSLMGGMISSTILTLFFSPLLFGGVERFRRSRQRVPEQKTELLTEK